MTRYAAAVVEARSLLRTGAIGELRQARLGLFHGSYLDPARPISWRLRAEQAGGGAMLDLGLHLVDLLRFLFGEPELLAARHATFLTDRSDASGGRLPVDVDDWAWAEVRLPGGGKATIEASRISLGADRAGGALWVRRQPGRRSRGWPLAAPPPLRRAGGSFRSRVAADPELRAVGDLRPPARLTLGTFVDGHAAALHHFLLRVLGGDPVPSFAPTLADSAAAERLVAAATAGPD